MSFKIDFRLIKDKCLANRSKIFLISLPILFTIFIFIEFTLPAWYNLSSQKEILQEKIDLYSRYQKKISKYKPNLEKDKIIFSRLNQKIFIGPDPYVIVSEIENIIKNIPEITMRSFRISKHESLGNQIEKIKIILVLQGDIKGLLNFLSLLREEKKPLKIKRLVVSSARYRGIYRLNINLEVEALYAIKAF